MTRRASMAPDDRAGRRAGQSWTGRIRFCILQTGKKSREAVGLTVSRTCTQQGLNRYMFHNCGAAAYGPINLKKNKKKCLSTKYEYAFRRGFEKRSVGSLTATFAHSHK
jgi:hypothetical protein